MRFRLRTLLIVLALGPPVIGILGPPLHQSYRAWQAERARAAKGRALLEAIAAQLVEDPVSRHRQSIRGHLLDDLKGTRGRCASQVHLVAHDHPFPEERIGNSRDPIAPIMHFVPTKDDSPP